MKKTAQVLFLFAGIGSAVLFGFLTATALSHPSGPAPTDGSGVQASRTVWASESVEPAYYEGHGKADFPTVALPDFAEIFERTSKSVVGIQATKFTNQERGPGNQFFEDPFHWFFGRPGQGEPHPGQPRREESGGTGFIITPDGYVLTNYHVVEDADVVRVQMNVGGTVYEGRVVGSDPPTDIALVKIDADQPFAYLRLGDSSRLRVGEWVMAIGNPFFYTDSATVGIVSAKGRRLDGLSRDPSLDDYIQTDAAINAGNSGGPLLNLQGEVIGINTAVSRIGQGIGFAIPIEMAKSILPQLRKTGHVSRGAIGVSVADISNLDQENQEYFGLKGLRGALVQDVQSGKAADRAGVKPGDAIVAIDGEPLAGSNDLIARISAHRPGDTIELTLIREGRRKRVHVQLEDREEIWFQSASTSRNREDGSSQSTIDSQIGIQVEGIGAENRRRFNLPAGVRGVVITDVSVRGESYDKGLRPGMVILEVNRQPVNSVSDYMQILEDVKDGGLVTFYVQTGESHRFVTFRVGGR
ncbi:MAG: trypsin-like peptidase domain-containing protein [Acidobacteriota bacterium]